MPLSWWRVRQLTWLELVWWQRESDYAIAPTAPPSAEDTTMCLQQHASVVALIILSRAASAYPGPLRDKVWLDPHLDTDIIEQDTLSVPDTSRRHNRTSIPIWVSIWRKSPCSHVCDAMLNPSIFRTTLIHYWYAWARPLHIMPD